MATYNNYCPAYEIMLDMISTNIKEHEKIFDDSKTCDTASYFSQNSCLRKYLELSNEKKAEREVLKKILVELSSKCYNNKN
jgi:hypothetical protein